MEQERIDATKGGMILLLAGFAFQLIGQYIPLSF
jgi:hypothetical protein